MSVGTIVGAITQWGGNVIRSLRGKPKPDAAKEAMLDRALAANKAEKASTSLANQPDTKPEE